MTGSDTHRDAADEHTVVSGVDEAATNAETTAPGVHHDVSNTQPIVFGVRSHVANTHTTVSDSHRSKLGSGEGADGQNQAVSTTRTLSPTNHLPLHRLTPGQRSRLHPSSLFNVATSAPGESLPPPPRNTRGTASDVRRDVSEVHRDLVNTQVMVSDMHRNMLKSKEEATGQPQLVSVTHTLSIECILTVA
jgi:hypothetical protein